MSSLDQLRRSVALGESELQEFKVRTSQGCRRAAAETLTGMLNKRGGTVMFGVEPDGQIIGQSVSDKSVEDVAAELLHIEPRADFVVDRVVVAQDREVLAVRVPRGSAPPYTYKGRAFGRVGNSTVALTDQQYRALVVEASHARDRWEARPADGWGLEDLDFAEITLTIEEAVRRGRLTDPETRDPYVLLRGLGLLADGVPTCAAVVLFAREDRLLPAFAQCRVRLARFKGVDRNEFIDNRQFEGNAFQLLQRANRFLLEHLPVAGRIVGGAFERVDDPIYPPAALREALANAFCHRDYAVAGGSVSVAIYDDRLEIGSTGGLHFGLTPADLYGDHPSLPWNPLIASVFFKRGVIESWGRGTTKMAELTTRVGLPRPEFEEVASTLVVRFRPSVYLPPQRIGRDLTRQQQELLWVLSNGGAMSLSEIVGELGGRDKRGVQTDLQFLRSVDLVRGTGHARGARWMLSADESA